MKNNAITIWTKESINNLTEDIFNEYIKEQKEEKFIIFEKKNGYINTDIINLKKVLSLKNTNRNIITIAYLNRFFPHKSLFKDIYCNYIINSIRQFIIDELDNVNWETININSFINFLEKGKENV